MAKIYTSADQLIGGTPLLELTHIEKAKNINARLLAKLEFLNPAGSSKDRVGRSMLDDAEAKGLLKPGSVIIEPTSGNTGIGLASVAAARGYRLIIVMPDSMSAERITLMKAYGAEVVLTPGAQGMAAAIEKAVRYCEEDDVPPTRENVRVRIPDVAGKPPTKRQILDWTRKDKTWSEWCMGDVLDGDSRGTKVVVRKG